MHSNHGESQYNFVVQALIAHPFVELKVHSLEKVTIRFTAFKDNIIISNFLLLFSPQLQKLQRVVCGQAVGSGNSISATV